MNIEVLNLNSEAKHMFNYELGLGGDRACPWEGEDK